MRYPVLLVSLTACKASLGEGMSDAGATDAMPATADAPAGLGPWATPTPVPITPDGDDDPSLTGDLLELYFNRASDIYVTTRASISDPWQMPSPVVELNSLSNETTPEVSYDGRTIYFASNRTPTLGGNDIWMATRAARTDPWGTPVHVVELSSAAAEGAAAPTHPLAIVIDSDRPGSAMLDLYLATRGSAGAAWGTPAPLAALNTSDAEGNPMLTEDRLAIYFDSNRTGDGELYVATRASPSGAFGPAERIEELASTGADSDPWISPDGRTMYFTSNRDGTLRLWQTSR